MTIVKTTYKDNRYLTPDDIKDLENETDFYYHSVYTLGNWGILGDVIFTNWRVEDLSEMTAQFTNRRHGLDFGFSSDPAAVVNTHYDTGRKTIYIYRELYETGLTNDILAERVREMITDERIVADSSEPKSIAELNNHSVYAAGAVKGKDSVNFGIDWLKQQTIIVDKSFINMQNELSQYTPGWPLNWPRPASPKRPSSSNWPGHSPLTNRSGKNIFFTDHTTGSIARTEINPAFLSL